MKELDLSNNDLQDSGAKTIFAGLIRSHCELEILRLALWNLCKKKKKKTLVYKMGSELDTSSLKELDLSNNDLEDSGAETIFPGLIRSHCELEILRSARTTNANYCTCVLLLQTCFV
ncbi:hypothetical protein NFI96_021185 [Prochilodus magdalenae]|nr:hypothetical protein NFI96_021185 [Prochilodus magdalenae]